MAERAVNQLIVATLTQNQYDALVSFVFNVGRGNFDKSTLRVTVNNDPNDKQISLEFKRWVYASKVLLPGLVRRRDDESNLYLRP
jgi:lysozyme